MNESKRIIKLSALVEIENAEKAGILKTADRKVFSALFPLHKRFARLFLNILFRFIPLKLQLAVLNLIKRKENKTVYREPRSFFIYSGLKDGTIGIRPSYPDNKRFFIGLTFDIDNKFDFMYLPYFLDSLKENGIPATVNLVTHTDYEITGSFLESAIRGGFEIGLHGDIHDSSISFLPKRVIMDRLKKAVDKLGFLPGGYRTPGLSFSFKMIEAISELGFLYDSSLTTGISMYRSIEFPYIFQYEDYGIYEIPLFMQDYNYFVNNLYGEGEAYRIFESQILQMEDLSGVAVLNFHPMMIHDKKIFWRRMIGLMRSVREKACISTLGNMVKNRP